MRESCRSEVTTMINKKIPSSMPFSQIVDGIQIPGKISADAFRSAVSYRAQPDDIFLVTYPECGTIWAQHILHLIFSLGEPMTDSLRFFTAAPFLEMTGAEGVEKMSRPGVITTHLPYRLTPRCDKATYIYITRNPMDCCVSYFHHVRNLPIHAFEGNFNEFFELFLSGNVDFGDYFDHLLGWYKHRNDLNVLFMTYEEMEERLEEAVVKMAAFIDEKKYAEPIILDQEKLDIMLKYSSFDYMKETVDKNIEEMFKMDIEVVENSDLPTEMKKFFATMKSLPNLSEPISHIRKGVIGDWKNYFNEDQTERLKEKFAERTKNTDIAELWENYM